MGCSLLIWFNEIDGTPTLLLSSRSDNSVAQLVDEILAVGFNQALLVTFGEADEKVTNESLHPRMQVQLRLFYNEERMRRGNQAHHEHGQYLTHSNSNGGKRKKFLTFLVKHLPAEPIGASRLDSDMLG